MHRNQTAIGRTASSLDGVDDHRRRDKLTAVVEDVQAIFGLPALLHPTVAGPRYCDRATAHSGRGQCGPASAPKAHQWKSNGTLQ
jgi:hypothetical protein